MANKKIASFELKIYEGKAIKGEADYSYHGKGDEWQNYRHLRFPGFDASISLSLEDFWQTVTTQNFVSYAASLIGYETIVKFGNTMQTKTNYFVEGFVVFEE